MERPDEVAVQANSAVYYERRYSGWGLRYHKAVIDWMMEGVWPDYATIDAGCGTGIVTRLNPSYLIRGIDISPEMIKRSPATCEVGDINSIQIPNNQADAIICRSLLHHLPNHKKALREFHRVLKPGGKLVCWETNKGWLAQKVRARTQHGDRFSEFHHAFRPHELERDFEEAGFKVQEVRYMGFLAYGWGFPDILPVEDYIPFKPIFFPLTMAVDYLLESIPLVNHLSWAVGIKATKV